MRVSISKMCKIAYLSASNDVKDLCVWAGANSSHGAIEFSVLESMANNFKDAVVTSRQMRSIDEFVIAVKYEAVIN